jgi:hypothetical protein
MIGLSMLKTPKRREELEILARPPYGRGHDRDSFRCSCKKNVLGVGIGRRMIVAETCSWVGQ